MSHWIYHNIYRSFIPKKKIVAKLLLLLSLLSAHSSPSATFTQVTWIVHKTMCTDLLIILIIFWLANKLQQLWNFDSTSVVSMVFWKCERTNSIDRYKINYRILYIFSIAHIFALIAWYWSGRMNEFKIAEQFYNKNWRVSMRNE